MIDRGGSAADVDGVVEVPSDEGQQDLPAVKVGVLLDQEPGKIGEWLADAAAFDAGGADALWVDPGPEPELDVLALAAALAAVTFRARLVVALPSSGTGTAGLARTLDTIGRLSHGRLVLIADPGEGVGLGDVAAVRRIPGEPGTFEGKRAGAQHAGAEHAGVEVERWVSVPAPQGRASWRAACADAARHGAQGMIVPADPRLLDILRNPDDPGDRHDLQLAQG